MSLPKKSERILSEYDLHCRSLAQSSFLEYKESPSEQAARTQRLERSYIDWFEYYFKFYAQAPCASFHKDLADIIIKNPQVNLLAEIYRSGAKSVHLDMGVPLFLYVKKQLSFMLLVGETHEKAKKLLSDIQSQLEFNQRWIRDYGRRFKLGHWSEGDFTTSDEVKFMALGFNQSPRGLREGASRPDYIVVDDIDSKKRCNNDKLSRLALEWVWEDLRGCFDEGAPRRRFVVANNNFHKNTVINGLKQEFMRIRQEPSQRDRYHILTVKAVKDLESFSPSWPQKTSSEYWREKFTSVPYRSFMREYMHTHIQDGAIFKAEHMEYKEILPLEDYEAMVSYGDLSYKENKDYKAIILAGKRGKEIHVIEAFLGQGSRKVCAEWLYDLYEEKSLARHNIYYLIEGSFAQDEFISDFDKVGDERGYHIPVCADKRAKDNKYDRIESMAGYFERGDVFFNIEKRESRHFSLLIDQLLCFEKGSGAHDDGPDALQSAIAQLNKMTLTERFPSRVCSRKELVMTRNNRF